MFYSLAPERRPLFVPDCLGGIGALEFGNSILQTAPFEQPLKQPVTLIVVAKCRGDTTICDSLSRPLALSSATATRPPPPRATRRYASLRTDPAARRRISCYAATRAPRIPGTSTQRSMTARGRPFTSTA